MIAHEFGLVKVANSLPSLRLICEIHKQLMQDVRRGAAIPRESRREQNWNGSTGSDLKNARYVPPPPAEIAACLDGLERFFREENLPPLAHGQFEAIHPFVDGNGRVGRLPIALLLMKRKRLPRPLLCLGAYFEDLRSEYYGHLLGITEDGTWEDWLVFFARCAHQGSGCAPSDSKDRRITRELARRLCRSHVATAGNLAGNVHRVAVLDLNWSQNEVESRLCHGQTRLDQLKRQASSVEARTRPVAFTLCGRSSTHMRSHLKKSGQCAARFLPDSRINLDARSFMPARSPRQFIPLKDGGGHPEFQSRFRR